MNDMRKLMEAIKSIEENYYPDPMDEPDPALLIANMIVPQVEDDHNPEEWIQLMIYAFEEMDMEFDPDIAIQVLADYGMKPHCDLHKRFGESVEHELEVIGEDEYSEGEFTDKNEQLHYRGYPVYSLNEMSTLFTGWFAFAGDKKALKEIEQTAYSFTPRPGYGDIRLLAVEGDEGMFYAEEGKLIKLPIVNGFTPPQLKRIGAALTSLNGRNVNMNPDMDLFTTM